MDIKAVNLLNNLEASTTVITIMLFCARTLGATIKAEDW